MQMAPEVQGKNLDSILGNNGILVCGGRAPIFIAMCNIIAFDAKGVLYSLFFETRCKISMHLCEE